MPDWLEIVLATTLSLAGIGLLVLAFWSPRCPVCGKRYY